MSEPHRESPPPTQAARRRSAPAGTRQRTAAIAITLLALVAAGSAVAASKLNGGSSSAQGGSPSPPTGRDPGLGFSPRNGGFGFHHARAGGVAAAASYLGLSEAQLFSEISQGKTLADIAGSTPGKSVEGLVTAMASAAKANLDALVASGRLTQSQADSIVSELTMRIEAMVQGDRFGGRPRWGFGGPAPGDRPQPATPSGGATL